MPLICIGPVCIPWIAVWPMLLLLWTPLEKLLRKTPLAKYLPAPKPTETLEERVKANQEKANAGGAGTTTEVAHKKTDGGVVVVESGNQWMALQSSGTLLCVFWTATWCGPCKRCYPIYTDLAAKHSSDKVAFLKIDVDKMSELSSDCGIQAMPTLQIYRSGKLLGSMTGANDVKLKKFVAEHCT